MSGKSTAAQRRPRDPVPTGVLPTPDLHAPAKVLARNADVEFWTVRLTQSVRQMWGPVRAAALAEAIQRMAGNTALVISQPVAFSDDPFHPINLPLPAVSARARDGAASGEIGRR